MALLFTMALPLVDGAHAVAREYSAIVVDADTGEVLRADDADEPRYPASLTKMMTLYLTFEALRRGDLTLDQRMPVSAHAQSQPPTKLGVRKGHRLKVRDAILALVTQSANDAAVVLAEAQAGTESAFARRMTAKARALGMKHTTYRNASGLPDPDQITTASDYAILSRALLRDFPDDYRYFSTRKFVWKGRTFGNHNHLLEKYDGADGIKTGYINASGFNLAASAERGGRRIIAIMFGGHTAAGRDRKVMALLDGGFADLGVSGDVRIAKNKTDSKTARAAPVRLASTRHPTHKKGAGHQPGTLQSLVQNAIVSSAEAAEPPAGGGPVVTTGAWGVQVGAFSRKTLAKKRAVHAVRKAPSMLGPARQQISRVRLDSGDAVYRVRFIGMTEKEARRACRTLKPAKIGCLPIAPSRQIATN